MDYRDRVFMTVAEKLNFSRAAEALFISQPAVTNHIKALEDKLKVTLFERKGNRIYLTAAGKLAYNHLKPIRRLYQELDFELERLNDSFRGTLRIGASSTIAQYVLPKIIAAFYRRYPHLKLYLLNGNSSSMEQKLLTNDVDLALVENEASQANLKYLDFLDDELVLVAGSNSIYAKHKVISIADLKQIPLVLRESGSGTLQVIQKALSNQRFGLDGLNVLMHLGSTEAIKNFLYDFDGVALVSEKSIEKELRLQDLVKINVRKLSLERKFRIVLRQGHTVAATKLLVDYLLHYNQ